MAKHGNTECIHHGLRVRPSPISSSCYRFNQSLTKARSSSLVVDGPPCLSPPPPVVLRSPACRRVVERDAVGFGVRLRAGAGCAPQVAAGLRFACLLWPRVPPPGSCTRKHQRCRRGQRGNVGCRAPYSNLFAFHAWGAKEPQRMKITKSSNYYMKYKRFESHIPVNIVSKGGI